MELSFTKRRNRRSVVLVNSSCLQVCNKNGIIGYVSPETYTFMHVKARRSLAGMAEPFGFVSKSGRLHRANVQSLRQKRHMLDYQDSKGGCLHGSCWWIPHNDWHNSGTIHPVGHRFRGLLFLISPSYVAA